jgi:hypothetical protein
MRVVLAAFAAIAALTLASSAGAGQQSYMDPGGDSGGADVSGVSVTTDPGAGTITFQVQTNLSAWDANTFFAVLIDADQNAGTGQAGFDYIAAADQHGGTLVNIVHPYVIQEPSSLVNGLWTETIRAADIGNSSAFNFFVLTQTGPDPRNPLEDRAPDAGTWTYPAAPPPPPPPPPAPTVSTVGVTYAGLPTHGKSFRVTGLALGLSDGTAAAATGLTCTATLGAKRLAGTGVGGCQFTLPKRSKKQRLTLSVSGAYASSPVAKTSIWRVR